MNNKCKKMAFGIMYSIGLLYSAGRFIYWNLDNQYGDGYTIRECLEANSKVAFNALNNIYDEALFDIYVFLTYLIICFVLIIYVKKH